MEKFKVKDWCGKCGIFYINTGLVSSNNLECEHYELRESINQGMDSQQSDKD